MKAADPSGRIVIEVGTVLLNVFRKGTRTSGEDCVALDFGSHDDVDAEDQTTPPDPETEKEHTRRQNRPFVLYFVALVAELQRILPRDKTGRRRCVSAEMLWDMGGQELNRLKPTHSQDKAAFCGNSGFYETWMRKLRRPKDKQKRPYGFDEINDAQLFREWAKQMRLTPRGLMETIFWRETVNRKTAKAMEQRCCSLYGLAPDWDVTVVGIEQLAPAVRAVFTGLPAKVRALTAGETELSERLDRYLEWAEHLPELQPPAVVLDVRVSSYEQPEWRQDRVISVGKPGLVSESAGATGNERTWTATDVLCRADQRIVLIGDPGSGKTVALLARFKTLLKEATENGNAPLPIYVDLTNVDPCGARSLEEAVLSHIGPILVGKLRALADVGRDMILLFDGLDRLKPGASLAQTARNVMGFSFERGIRQVVMTCSKAQWSDTFLGGATAAVYGILTLDLGPGRNAERYVRTRVPHHARRLLDDAREPDSQLGDMVRHPVYLSLLCDYLRGKKADTLFPAYPGRLLHSWVHDQLRGQNGTWYKKGARESLMDIAAFMVKQGVVDVPVDDLTPVDVRTYSGWQQHLDDACSCRILAPSARPDRTERIRFQNHYLRDYFASLWLKAKFAAGSHELILDLLQDTGWDQPFIFAVQNDAAMQTLVRVLDRLVTTDLFLFTEVILCGRTLPSTDVKRWAGALEPMTKKGAFRHEATCVLCALDACSALPILRQNLGDDSLMPHLLMEGVRCFPAADRLSFLKEVDRSDNERVRDAAARLLAEYEPVDPSGLLTAYTQSRVPPPLAPVITRWTESNETQRVPMLIRALTTILPTVRRDPKPVLTREWLATWQLDMPAEGFVRYFSPSTIRGQIYRLADARDIMESLLATNSTEAVSEVKHFLAQPTFRPVVALLIAQCDPHLLFHARLRALQAAFLDAAARGATKGSYECDGFADAIARDVQMLATRHDEVFGSGRLVPPDLATGALEALTAARPDDLWGLGRPDDDEKGELWYFLQRSNLCDSTIAAKDTAYLWRCAIEERLDVSVRERIVQLLTVVDPHGVLTKFEVLRTTLPRESIAFWLSEAAEVVDELPPNVAEELFSAWVACRPRIACPYAGTFAKRPRTDEMAHRLAGMIKAEPPVESCHDALLDLLNSQVLWDHPRILEILRRRLRRERTSEGKVAAAACLADCGDEVGWSHLIKPLPKWVNKAIPWSTVRSNREHKLFRPLVVALRQSSIEELMAYRIHPIIAYALGILGEDDCKRLISETRANLSENDRAEVFSWARDLVGRRFFDLL